MMIAAALFWVLLLDCSTAGFASRSALASEAMNIYVVTYKSTALPEDIRSIEQLIIESGGLVYYYNDEIYGFIVGMPDTATGLECYDCRMICDLRSIVSELVRNHPTVIVVEADREVYLEPSIISNLKINS